MNDLFQEIILDEAKHPQNYGVLEGAKKHIQFNPSCGDTVQVYLNLENDSIKEVKWTGEGCTISMATMSLLSDLITGMKIESVQKLEQADLLKLLELDSITPGRIKCLQIGLSAVQELLKNQPQ